MTDIFVDLGGDWALFLPGKAPETIAEAVQLRASLRDKLRNRPGLFALFGFRAPRKKRAARTTDHLRSPTKADNELAVVTMDEGMTVFEAQEYFRSRGIAMTANHLSQLGGARP